MAPHTTKVKSTVEMLVSLSEMYEKPSAANNVHLMRRLFNQKMSEGTTVAEHLHEFNMIQAQLSSVRIDFEHEIRALIVRISSRGYERKQRIKT